MNVCFAIPVADTDEQIKMASHSFADWQVAGYLTAALLNGERTPRNCDLIFRVPEYHGWAWAVNHLARSIDSDWIVTGGADCDPPCGWGALDIAAECRDHFGGTLGVMQCAGDRYGAIKSGTACVSPWLGREWCRRAYGGRGPLCELYPAYYADTELKEVAEKLGLLWWREDLSIYHNHYLRTGKGTPAHLAKWQKSARSSRRLFHERREKGFPGHELKC